MKAGEKESDIIVPINAFELALGESALLATKAFRKRMNALGFDTKPTPYGTTLQITMSQAKAVAKILEENLVYPELVIGKGLGAQIAETIKSTMPKRPAPMTDIPATYSNNVEFSPGNREGNLINHINLCGNYRNTMHMLPEEDQLIIANLDSHYPYTRELACRAELPSIRRALFERAATLPEQALGEILSTEENLELINEFFIQKIDELTPRELLYLMTSPVIDDDQRRVIVETHRHKLPDTEENGEIVYKKIFWDWHERAMEVQEDAIRYKNTWSTECHCTSEKRPTIAEELLPTVEECLCRLEAKLQRIISEKTILQSLMCEDSRGPFSKLYDIGWNKFKPNSKEPLTKMMIRLDYTTNLLLDIKREVARAKKRYKKRNGNLN